MTSAVFDASAILALVNGENGSDAVLAVLDNASVCSVNHAEVVTKLVERGLTLNLARETLRSIGVTVIDFDVGLAERTGDLRRATKDRGLSLADRACLALAEREGVFALTADRTWAGLDLGVEVRLIR